MPRSLQLDSHLPRVWLKSAGLHPLVYRKRIARVDREAAPGDIVEVLDDDSNRVGFGLYNPKSELALRILSRGDELPDEAWWQRQLAEAVRLRREILKLDESADAFAACLRGPEGQEGVTAFLEKRKPSWTA